MTLVACEPVSQIVTGEDAWRYRRYPEAISLLEQEIEKTKDDDIKARKSYWVAESYRLMNDDEASISWYRKAYDLSNNQVSMEAYANALMRSQQYSNAKKLYIQLIDRFGQKAEWDIALKSCDAAKTWIADQNPNQYVIRKSKVNSPASDYSPVFYNDIMVFTSDRDVSRGDQYHWTGQQFTDFYRSKENPALDALLYRINGPYNEASLTFNSDLTHVVYTQCGTDNADPLVEHCKLMEARYDIDGEVWTSFKPVSFCKEGINYGHPTFFNFDQGLIFSSNDPDGLGGFDLYVSYLNTEGWTNPVLLPEGLNTSTGDEKFPSMQGDTLYFSSNGKVGMGGLDIFYSKWISPDGWTQPINAKPPINSGADDFGLVFEPNFKRSGQLKNRFYISSNRKGSRLDDIYVFDEMVTEKTDTAIVEDPGYEIVIEGKILEQIYEVPGDPNSRKMGTRPLSGANIRVGADDAFPEKVVDKTGEFEYILSDEKYYRFVANLKGYLSNSRAVDVKLSEEEKSRGGKTYIVHIVLDPIIYNTEIVMEDIFYDFDKWDIREDAEPSLKNLADLLTDNPDIKIELASHTDCRGPEIYNAELSQRRASSAVAFLELQGIVKNRMRAAGYGEQKPAVVCACDDCTEEEHQSNRRTSFTILSD